MKFRKLLIGLALLALIGVGGWYGWRSYTTPSLPDIPLAGASQPIVDAVEEARQEVRRQPRNGETWGKLGKVLAANGYREPAIRCFANAARFDPNNPSWPYLRGVELLQGDPQQGIINLRQALVLARKQERAVILSRLSSVLIAEGQLEEATERLQTLGQIEPDGTRVNYGLGLLAIAREDWTGARERLSKLTEDPLARKKACTLLATLPDARPEIAQTYQQLASQLPPDFPWPDPYAGDVARYKVNRGAHIEEYWELDGQGRQQEAIEVLRRSVAESPDVESCFLLGFALYKMNEFQEATNALRAAVGFDPQHAKSHHLLGGALLAQGEKRLQEPGGTSRAMELFRQAVAAEDQCLALQNNLGYAHLTRGLALKCLGRTDESLQALRQALLCQPEAAEIHEKLGESLAEAGQLPEALTHLENAVRLSRPDDPRPRAILAKWQAKAKAMP